MIHRQKATALIAVAIMLLAMTPAVAEITSLTSSVTNGIFTSDADNYMSVNTYDKVAFDKWFGVIRTVGTTPQLGFATKINGIYIGTSYEGTLFSSSGDDSTNIQTTPTVTDGVVSSTSTTTEKYVNSSTINTDNTINALIGFGGMGIKLTFDEDMNHSNTPVYSGVSFGSGNPTETTTTDTSTKTTTTTKYTNTYHNSGNMTPGASWGMNLNLDSMILRPNATLSVAFNQEASSAKKESSTTVSDTTTSTTTGYYTVANSNLEPKATVGAILEFPKADGAQAFASLSYTFDMKLFIGNNYLDASGASTAFTGTGTGLTSTTITDDPASSKTTVTSTDLNMYDKSYMKHSVTPQFKFKKEFDNQLSIGFGAAATLSGEFQNTTTTRTQKTVTAIDSYSQTPGSDTTETQVITTNSGTQAITSLSVSPSLKTGLVYKILPGKVTMNAGYALYVPSFSSTITTNTDSLPNTTTVKKVDENGVVLTDTETTTVSSTRTESQEFSNTWGSMSQVLSAGLTFNINDKMAFDAVMYSASTSTSTWIDLTYLTLMFTIKQ